MKALLLLVATMLMIGQAFAGKKEIRWERNDDNGSILFVDSEHGSFLALEDEVSACQIFARKHYGWVNPDSYKDTKLGFDLDLTVAPRHVLTDTELDAWAVRSTDKWQWQDLLKILYWETEWLASSGHGPFIKSGNGDGWLPR